MKSLELPTYNEWKTEFEQSSEYMRNRNFQQWKFDNKRLNLTELCEVKTQSNNERTQFLLLMESAKKLATAILAHDSPENKFKWTHSENTLCFYVNENTSNEENIYKEFLLAQYREHLDHKTHMFKWTLNIDASQASAEE